MDSKVCKTCGIDKRLSEFSTGGPVHKNGKRSLRAHCKSCRRKPKWERKNVGIGHFEDNINLLLNAIDYLKRYE